MGARQASVAAQAKRPLRVLISSGPTREPIDPVRFISNSSTGYMGAQLAAVAIARGHRVTVVNGPSAEPLPAGARVIPVVNAREMERALRAEAAHADVVIMAAAVSDFRSVHPAVVKLPRRARLVLTFEATPDLIARLPRRAKQLVVGFSLETDRVVSKAERKLHAKRLDLLLAQRVNGNGSPFGRRHVHAWLLERGRTARALGRVSKPRVARVLLDKIERLWYGQQDPKNDHDAART